MAGILSEILDRKRKVVARLRTDAASRDLRDRASATRAKATPHPLLWALESNAAQINIIAEFKRRSPSAGTIRNDLSASEVAACYERGGACAISVLTDEENFGGSILDLAAIRAITDLPLLRKDFIIDENADGVRSRWERVDNSTGDSRLDVARTLPIKIKPNHVGAEFNARVRIIRVCETTDFDLCFCRHQTCRASVSGATVACLRRASFSCAPLMKLRSAASGLGARIRASPIRKPRKPSARR